TAIAGDCDDSDPRVHPAGTETCDGRDNDCNGQVDDPNLFDYDTYYADTDGDTYGDPANTTEACSQPLGYVSDDSDCDDTDGTVYPGADEDGGTGSGVADGVDNDCDGAIDDNLLYGTGADGALSIVDGTFADIGGACVEVWSVVGDQVVVSDASAFSPGDRAMVISLEGRPTEADDVGRWTLLDVGAVDPSANTVTALEAVSGSFGPDNSQLRSLSVALLRVPQVTDLTVSGTLSAEGFDGDCGGVMAILATGTVDISGTLDLRGAGYEGGDPNNSHDSSGRAGTSTEGRGDKGTVANVSGGGGGGSTGSACGDCTGSGAGGSHGSEGFDGESSNDLYGSGGASGAVIGDTTLVKLHMGGGGGAGALDSISEDGIGGAGGAGGGALLLRAAELTVTGAIDARGADGNVGCGTAINGCGHGASSEAGSGGGGAGGAIYLVATTLQLAVDSILATGGAGAESAAALGVYAGDGGDGRIRLDYSSLNGEANGSEAAAAEGNIASAPNPGFIGSP
ncbi:MAG: putative metal-binding motif-containing protein, partial [Myxococcota bacterium]|nr:putative metal-binding motif-containing protein [Myxococcota bacterium]